MQNQSFLNSLKADELAVKMGTYKSGVKATVPPYALTAVATSGAVPSASQLHPRPTTNPDSSYANLTTYQRSFQNLVPPPVKGPEYYARGRERHKNAIKESRRLERRPVKNTQRWDSLCEEESERSSQRSSQASRSRSTFSSTYASLPTFKRSSVPYDYSVEALPFGGPAPQRPRDYHSRTLSTPGVERGTHLGVNPRDDPLRPPKPEPVRGKGRYDLSKFTQEERKDMQRALCVPRDSFHISGFPPEVYKKQWK